MIPRMMSAIRHDRAAAASGGLQQRGECHDAALAAVIGAHDGAQVLDRHHHRNRPEHERDHAVDLCLRRVDGVVIAGEDRLQRVQRARPDVAKDHAECPQRERRDSGADRGTVARLGRSGAGRGGEATGGHRGTVAWRRSVGSRGPRCRSRQPDPPRRYRAASCEAVPNRPFDGQLQELAGQPRVALGAAGPRSPREPPARSSYRATRPHQAAGGRSSTSVPSRSNYNAC